jgi:hypothetical protein
MSQNLTELDLYSDVLAAFNHQQHCFTEVPFYGKKIDLVLTGKSFRIIYAVEVKLDDWRAALKQASVNQLFACYSYIAVPGDLAERLLTKNTEIFTSHGVGIIAVSTAAKVVLPAAKSTFIYAKHRAKIMSELKRSRQGTAKPLGVVKNAITAGRRSMEFLQTRAS